jgi:indole-3-glycerol phosphate synthase
MANKLLEIANYKKQEVAARKTQAAINVLEQMPLFALPTQSFIASVQRQPGPGFITEFKRKSPSAGFINQFAKVQEVLPLYAEAGAAGASILTDEPFFGGSLQDLQYAKACTHLPLLRKDFIVDEYQLYEAKANGADAILLIAAMLTQTEVLNFTRLAHELSLEVLFEIHDYQEFESRYVPEIKWVGVNNRNLKTFEIDINTSLHLIDKLPNDVLKISESGIQSHQEVAMLYAAGYKGFLIGTNFMKTAHPGRACIEFIKQCSMAT